VVLMLLTISLASTAAISGAIFALIAALFS
jgi:hypothetical protein